MDEGYEEAVRARRAEINDRIEAACRRAGRDPLEVTVIAVSKTVGPEEVAAAARAGYDRFGENRPQELVRKIGALAEMGAGALSFDMIGNLQKNKINAVLGRVGLIHSISSLHLAEAVSSRQERRREEGAADGPQDVLLEVNVSGEETKSGFSPDGLRAAVDALRGLRGIRVRGLMTMAPRGDKGIARATFAGLRELAIEISEVTPGQPLEELSCGMSEDFEVACEEGSTIVRLGRVALDPAFALE